MKRITTLQRIKGWGRSKLKLLTFLFMLFAGFSVTAQSVGTVQIGEGTATISGTNSIPVSNYSFNYSQHIILASEISTAGGAVGDVTKLRYKPTALGSNPERWNEFTVFLANTTKTDFSSTTDWVAYTDLTEVFSDELPALTAGDWFEIEFDQPFNYTGGNIVIAVLEVVPSWTSPNFQSYSVSENRGIMFRTDATASIPDPETPPTATAVVSNLPQVQFEMALASCLPPINYTIDELSDSNATILWEEWGDVPTEGFEWELLDADGDSIDFGIVLPTDDFEAVLTGLDALTGYTLRVKSLCSALEESGWSEFEFYTPCSPFTVWSENFDDYDTGSFLPDCWDRVISGTGSLTITSTSPASGTRNIYLYSSNASNAVMAVLPSFSNVSDGTHWLKLKARSSTANGTLKLGYVVNSLNIDDFVELEDILLPNTSYATGEIQVFQIPDTIPANARLAVLNPGLNSYSFYLDDFSWEEIPSCIEVSNMDANGITATGAELSWISDGDLFDVEIVEEGEEPSGTPSDLGVDNPFVTVTPLTPATSYDYYVRQDCGFGDLSVWVGPFTFTTECSVFEDPFTENFDSTPTGTSTNPTVPTCWSFIDTGAGYGYVSSTTPNTSPNNFYIYNSSDTSGDYILVSPETDNLGNGTMRVKFSARSATASQTLQVGTLSDAADPSTFTIVETIVLTTTHTDYSVVLPVTTDDFFGFRHGLDATYRSVYIDTVSYEEIPSCMEVSDLDANGVTSTGAELSWISDGNLFDIEIVEAGEDPTGVPTDVGVGNPFITVDPLTPITSYDYYVRQDCGAGDLSTWTGPYTFTTLCAVEMAPTMVEDFSSYTGGITTTSLPCWAEAKANNIGTPLTGTTSLWASSNYNNDASHINGSAAYINLYGSRDEWLVSPVIDLGDGTIEYALRYDTSVLPWSGSANVEDMGSDKYVAVVVSTDAGVTWSETNVLTMYDNNNIPNNGGFAEILSLDGYTGEVRFAFYAKSTATATDLRFYIDNFRVDEMPACLGPITGSAEDIGIEIATINWDTSGSSNASGYEYEVRTGEGDDEVVVATGSTIAPVTTADVTGLSGNTIYNVYVRSECNTDEFSEFNLITTFTTLCGIETDPFTENFDSTPTGTSTNPTVPTCWSFIDSGSGYGYVSSTTPNTSPNNFYIYNSSDTSGDYILVSPETDNLGDGLMRVVFYARSGTNGQTLDFGTMSDSEDATTFELLESIALTTTHTEYIVYLPVTTDDYFAFRHGQGSTYTSIYIDTISYEVAPTCYTVENITLDDVGKFSADISWDAPDLGNDVDDGYEVEIRTEGEPGDTVGYVDTVNTTSLTAEFTGLDPDTAYFVYIKTLCTEVNDESLWSEPFQFRTLCDAPVLVNVPGGEVCGSGSVELEAIYTSGIVEWYDSEEGGELLHTGETFTTSNITEETSFWVQAKGDDAVSGNGGPVSPAGTSATTPSTWGLIFDAYMPFTLNSVDVYLASSSAGSLLVRLTDSDGVTIEEQTIAVPAGGTASSPVQHTVQLDMEIPEGEDMRLLAISGPSMVRDSSHGGFPYELPGVGEITNGYINGTSTTYYFFYNWEFEVGCTSERTEVVVEITDAPEFSLSANTVAVCGTTPSEVVTVVEGLADYDVFEWTPSTGITGDETTGWTFNPTTSTTYTLIASKLTEDCAQTVQVEVSVGNYPTPAPLADGYSVCINEVQMLNVQVPVTGSNAHTVVWSPATDLYIDLAGTVPYIGQNVNRVYFKSPIGVEDAEYTVTVTNNSGCSVEDTTLINVPIITAPDLDVVYLCEVSSVNDINDLYDVDAVWYETVNSQVPLSTIGVSGTYYASTNLEGCQSVRVAVDVTVVGVSTPTADETTQQFCNSATIEEIIVNSTEGANLNIYETPTGGTALNAGTALFTGTFYIAEQIGDCESDRLAVQVTITQTPPAIAPATITICGFEVMANVEIGQQPNADLVWYANETTPQPMNGNSQVYDGTYYVSQRVGVCESPRTAITFIVNEVLPQPTASSQSFCTPAVVSDLVVTGAEGAIFRWFDSATSTDVLADNESLSNGTYYVSQELNGCESNRKAISVQIINTAAPQISNMSLCQGTTIAEVEIPATTGVTYKWYVSPTAITALPATTVLTNGTYFISSSYNGCESERVVVDIETTPVPNAPTGEAQQSFVYNISINEVTIADLVVNEADVLWFAHEDDAATLTNPLESDMPLSDGTTYYAVIVSDNGCVSDVFAVTVTVTLSNNKFDRAKLAYYPNPTQGILNIQYAETIERVEIYNTIGQLVRTQDFSSNQITVDMGNLSNGTYLLKLHIDGYQQLIKVVKN